jgi:IQ motif/SEC7 domain-containing protein
VKRQPLSQSNFQQHPSQNQSHAYVNLLHQQDQQYNNYQNYHSHNNNSNLNNNYAISSNNSSLNNSSIQQFDLNMSSASSNVNTTMNSSWNSYSNSPNASLIAQQQQQPQQFYIRPRTSSTSKKVPPEVPKRTSSIQQQNTPPKYQQISHVPHHHHNKSSHYHHHHHHVQHMQMKHSASQNQQQFYKAENGNHSSPDSLSLSSNSPIPSNWQHQTSIEQQQLILHQQYIMEQKHLQQQLIQQQNEIQLQAKLSETIRKRQYRIGLNLFNKKPEKGITYLMHKNFLENSPHAVSKFLVSRKGLSRQMIGEYLGNIQQPFNMAVLEYFAEEMDFSGLATDVALRKFQGYFRMPGEAQKIERLMEVFSHRYSMCNPDVISKLRSPDTVSHSLFL